MIFIEKLGRRILNFFLIGVQVRHGAQFYSAVDSPHQYLTLLEIQTMWMCAKNLEQKDRKTKFLVISDSSRVMQQAREIFGDQLLEINGTVAHTVAAQNEDDLTKAILDNFLLGECDEIIITPESSFSAAAVLRVGKLPLYPKNDTCLQSEAKRSPLSAMKQLVW